MSKVRMIAYRARRGRRIDFLVFDRAVLSAPTVFDCPQFPVLDIKTTRGKYVAMRLSDVGRVPAFSDEEIRAVRDKVSETYSPMGYDAFAVEVELAEKLGYAVFKDVKEVA